MLIQNHENTSQPLFDFSIDWRALFQHRSLKFEFSLARSIFNFSSVILALVCFRHAMLNQALVIAIIAGHWAAAMQFWNKEYLGWLSNAHWFKCSTDTKGTFLQAYLKKMMSSSLYAALIYLGMIASGQLLWQGIIIALGRIATTVGESLFTQTAWQRNNQDWKLDALQRAPGDTVFIENLSGLATLVQSVIAVMANVLNTSGSRFGLAITLSVGISGTILFCRRYLIRNNSRNLAHV